MSQCDSRDRIGRPGLDLVGGEDDGVAALGYGVARFDFGVADELAFDRVREIDF